MNGAYYNEHDPFAAAWLRELIRAGAIPAGDVDERDIQLVQPADLAGYRQCHFFAGIGGWAYALDLAGWPADRPVWTGSCPCQPYSAAGKGEGADDARNLWPHWFRLIRECRPATVFGEQVEAAIRHGWLDAVSTDLEAEGYAFGASVLGAHSVGAPHIRQRVFFVADAEDSDRGTAAGSEHARRWPAEAGRCGGADEPDFHMCDERCPDRCPISDAAIERVHASRLLGDPDHPRSQGRRIGGDGSDKRATGASSMARPLAYTDGGQSSNGDVQRGGEHGQQPKDGGARGPWSDLVWLPCRDGKARPTQPGIFPLAHGVPNRVGTLRGAGNAINPWTAAEVIGAFMDVSAATGEPNGERVDG